MKKRSDRFMVLVGKNESRKSKLLSKMIEHKVVNGKVYYYSSKDRNVVVKYKDNDKLQKNKIKGNKRYMEGFQRTCYDDNSIPYKICALINEMAINCKSNDALILDNIDVDLDLKTFDYIMSVLIDVHEKISNVEIVLTTHNAGLINHYPINATFYFIELNDEVITSTSNYSTSFLGSSMNRLSAFLKLVEGISSIEAIEFKVFTEAPNDSNFYKSIYDILSECQMVHKVAKLKFEASSIKDKGGGGSTVVETLVRQSINANDVKSKRKPSSDLQNPRLLHSFGFKDKDYYEENSGDTIDRIKVLKRHSMENYRYDPVIFSQLMSLSNFRNGYIEHLWNAIYLNYINVKDTALA